MDNLYLCVKNSNNEFIPFYTINGSFFSKIQNPKGGSTNLSLDDILQHVNYKEILENDKNKETQLPALETNPTGGAQFEIEISKNNVEESALPEDFKNYLRHKLNKY